MFSGNGPLLGRIFDSYGDLVVKRPILTIIVGVILLGVAIFGVMQMTMDPELEIYDKSSETYGDYELYEDNFAAGETIFIQVTVAGGSNATDMDVIRIIGSMEEKLMESDEVIRVTSISTLIRDLDLSGNGTIPSNRTMVGAIPDDSLQTFVPAPDTLLVIVNIESRDTLPFVNEVMDGFNKEQGADGDIGAKVVGNAVMLEEIKEGMMIEMRSLIGVAILIMIVILGIIFGHVKLRFLPLIMVMTGLVLTVGLMGYVKLPVSMVVIAVFPLLIGLGIDYSINLHNRIQEEVGKGNPEEGIRRSISKMGPSMSIALLATILGFVTLQFSTMTMLREFGIVVMIGVVMSFIVSISLLFSILLLYYRSFPDGIFRRSKKNDNTRKVNGGRWSIDNSLAGITGFSSRHPIPIITIAIILGIAGFVGGVNVDVVVDHEELVPQDLGSLEDLEELRDLIGGTEEMMVLVRAESIMDPEIIQWTTTVSNEIENNVSKITKVTSIASFMQMNVSENQLSRIPSGIRASLVNDEMTMLVIRLTLNESDPDKVSGIIDAVNNIISDPPAGSDVTLTGQPVLKDEVMGGMISDRDLLTVIGCILIFAGLLVVYRSFVKAAIPLIPIILVIGWSMGSMYLLGISLNPLTIGLGALIFGLGAEYTILLMERYHEQRGKGELPNDAMNTASRSIGRAIFTSGITTIGGFAALIMSSYPFIRQFGIVVVMDVLLILVSSLLVLPPIIVSIDRRSIARKKNKEQLERVRDDQ
ncbi:MAG: hydrophobe/amphiphile efflux-3 (HAE3) family transporter [Thermoplasmatota archaeon]